MNNRLFQTLISLFCTLVSVSLAQPYAAAQAQSEKLRVAYTVIAPTQANVWTAKEMGYYAKHGLDVELVLLVGALLGRCPGRLVDVIADLTLVLGARGQPLDLVFRQAHDAADHLAGS